MTEAVKSLILAIGSALMCAGFASLLVAEIIRAKNRRLVAKILKLEEALREANRRIAALEEE